MLGVEETGVCQDFWPSWALATSHGSPMTHRGSCSFPPCCLSSIWRQYAVLEMVKCASGARGWAAVSRRHLKEKAPRWSQTLSAGSAPRFKSPSAPPLPPPLAAPSPPPYSPLPPPHFSQARVSATSTGLAHLGSFARQAHISPSEPPCGTAARPGAPGKLSSAQFATGCVLFSCWETFSLSLSCFWGSRSTWGCIPCVTVVSPGFSWPLRSVLPSLTALLVPHLETCAASWLRFFWRSTSVLVQELRPVPCSVVVVAVGRLCGCVGSCFGDLGWRATTLELQMRWSEINIFCF